MSESSPAVVECVGCDGEGERSEGVPCAQCGGRGTILITQCPLEFAGDDVWEAMEMAALMKHGILPVPGAALDQAAIFMDAGRFIFAEQARQRLAMMERT